MHDEEGKPYSVRYDAVNATLLNEFLKEHRKVEEQTKKINRLESNLAEQRKDFEKCIAQQQKEIGVLAAQSGHVEHAGPFQEERPLLREEQVEPREVDLARIDLQLVVQGARPRATPAR